MAVWSRRFVVPAAAATPAPPSPEYEHRAPVCAARPATCARSPGAGGRVGELASQGLAQQWGQGGGLVAAVEGP